VSAGTLATWHAVVQQRDMALLASLLADDVVLHSPVVHTPQRGKAITLMYLQGAMQVLNTEHFHYVREIVGPRDALLEFVTQIDGLHVNGVDLIRWNDEGLIDDFKVMVRPLKAINALHQKMGELLQRLSAPPATGATP
jgi:ketosteroid isomerase-like protein